MQIGYCLWCGAEITVECFDIRNKLIEWKRCNAFHPCKGALTTVITDVQGFVVEPRSKKDCYIYARKIPEPKCNRNGQNSKH